MTTVIYSELDEDIFSEENLKEIRQDLFDNAVDSGEAEEEGWESPEDIPDEVVEEEAEYWASEGLTSNWEATWSWIEPYVDKPFIWYDGKEYFATKNWDEFEDEYIPVYDADFHIRLSDKDGLFVVDGYAHGEFYYEGKYLTDIGELAIDALNGEYDNSGWDFENFVQDHGLKKDFSSVMNRGSIYSDIYDDEDYWQRVLAVVFEKSKYSVLPNICKK